MVIVFAFYGVIVIGGLIGWGMNIYKLTQCDFKEPYKAEILRSVGLVPFVGAFMGYFPFKDEAPKTNEDPSPTE